MTALQKEAIALIPAISDEKLYYVLQIIKGVKGLETDGKGRKRIMGLAEGETLLADGYDMDAEDPEITALFEAM